MKDYWIKSNEEAGEGRSDLILRHGSGSGKGIIFEFKYERNVSHLETRAREALQQIDDRAYETALITEGYTEIIKYGIAFHKKSCKVVSN